MSVKLYKFGEEWGIADPSPFCVKLENYLRVAGVPFEPQPFQISDFKKSPKAKFPFLQFEDGTYMGDSNFLIDHLIAGGAANLDEELSVEQQAVSTAMRSMMDESLYWAVVHSRWVDPKGWELIGDLFFGKIPSFIRPIIAGQQQKSMKKSLYGQGFGRHSQDEIYQIGCENIQALGDLLGDKKNFFETDKPTLLDITAHAYLINIITPPIENAMKEFTLTQKNLVTFTNNLQETIYG